MRFLKTLVSLAFAGLASPAILAGQTFTPHGIVFEGAPQYLQSDLLSASGLKAGKAVTQADLDAATQRLGDIGLFNNITFASSGTTLRFTLEPTPPQEMRKAVFTNFVMFEPADLAAGVHHQVALFMGSVPVSGSMQQSVERALEAILKERGIQATVTSIPGPGGLDYSIASPPVKVASLAIDGADFNGNPSLAEIRSRFIGSGYIEGSSGAALSVNLIDAYADLGFVDAIVSPIKHGPPQITPDKIAVALTGTAVPGPFYKVARLDLPATAPGVPAPEIAAAAQLKVDGPASRILLLSTTARLTGAFTNHGYLDAETVVDPAKDASAHTIAYTFRETPGPVYRMRNLRVIGMGEQQTSVAIAAWKLPPGVTFEMSAYREYLHKTGALNLCPGHPLQGTLMPQKASREVDVFVSCGPPH